MVGSTPDTMILAVDGPSTLMHFPNGFEFNLKQNYFHLLRRLTFFHPISMPRNHRGHEE